MGVMGGGGGWFTIVYDYFSGGVQSGDLPPPPIVVYFCNEDNANEISNNQGKKQVNPLQTIAFRIGTEHDARTIGPVPNSI